VLLSPVKADITVSGTGLDLAALSDGVPDMKGMASGKFDLKFNVKSGSGQALTGTGSLRSDAASLFGIKLSNAVLPLSLAGGILKSEGGTLAFYGGKVANTFSLDLGTMKFSDSLEATGVDVNALAQDAAGGLNGKIAGKGNLSLKLSGAASPLSYSGSGQFTMGEGAITGFSWLGLVTKLYGVDGIRYTKVTAPLRIETNRLILAKGASAVPPQNDPIYHSARLAEDGSVTFDKKLYFVADLNVNFQLINALAGGAAGGVEALLKGGVRLDVKQLGSVLEGALTGGREQGKDADFRDATIKVTGTSEKPALAVVKVGASSKQQDTQQNPHPGEEAAPPAQTPKPGDVIRETIRDAIAPGKPQEPRTPQEPQESQEPQEPQEPATPEAVLEDQLRKGIDSLFKRK
jgi:hypothetical protein